MERGEERLLQAMGGIGSDLISRAETRRPRGAGVRRWIPAAACAAILAGGSFLLAQRLPAPPTAAELPAAEEQLPEQVPEAREPVEPARAKKRLTVLGTIYYQESVYTPEEAEPHLGAFLGTVEQADDPALEGCAVYEKQDSSRRDDLPLEIFVQTESGYVYCLTYYARPAPLHALVPPADWGRVLDGLPMADELLQLAFDSPADLEPRNQTWVFQLTLLWEKAFGLRTDDLNRYLWYDEAIGAYCIPVADVRRQLERYLPPECVDPAAMMYYDRDRDALVLDTLQPHTTEAVLHLKDLEQQEHTVTVTMETGTLTVTYTLELQPDRLSITAVRAEQ